MYCLAGIGGRVEGIMANTKAAATVLVIDGCKEECARKTMELAGFSGFAHLQLDATWDWRRGRRGSRSRAFGKWRTRGRSCWRAEA